MTAGGSIAIDAMGGDFGPKVTIPAAVAVLRESLALHFTFVGDESLLRSHLKPYQDVASRCTIQHASQQVEMHESPVSALKNKRDSSMRVAINLVRDGAAKACVSAGNTGALVAVARFVLKTVPGIDRPAIISPFPTAKGHSYVLDLGANVDCTKEHLLQFARMGSVLCSALDGIPRPTVALLNIGTEDMKGNEQVKGAAQAFLSCQDLNYIGFVEGNQLFEGGADVIVCDGFVGNVVLKASEGLVKLVTYSLKEAFMRNWLTKLSALPALPILAKLHRRMDPERYNGASLLGLQGIVVKSHGGATERAFAHAIRQALQQVQQDLPTKIHQNLYA